MDGKGMKIELKEGKVKYKDMEEENVDMEIRMNEGRLDLDSLIIRDVEGEKMKEKGN